MSIISENISVKIVRHYSDQNLKIKQIETDNLYDDAYDLIPCKYTYEETDIKIEEDFEEGGMTDEYSDR